MGSAYRELNPGTSAAEANEMVICAADALFVILEQAGRLGDAADDRLAGHASDGLAAGGCGHRSCSTSHSRCLLDPEATVRSDDPVVSRLLIEEWPQAQFLQSRLSRHG